VNPVQTSTYSLGTHNPTTFGGGTDINAATPSSVGVYVGSSTPWNVTNYGAIQGPSAGLYLRASGSTVTNWGAISGNAGAGIQLPNGGAVTNESGGSISGFVGVYIPGGVGTVTNAGTIIGQAPAVSVASGSVNNQSGGTLSMISGISAPTVYVGHGGSVTNEDKPADLTITISLDDLVAMGEGKLDAMSAVMGGKMQLSDMGLAMGLQGKMTTLFSKMA